MVCGSRLTAQIPFTNASIHYADQRIWRGAEPKRWDIVVFRAVTPGTPQNVLVKRIVGLPGERVNIANGRIYIDDGQIDPPEDLRGVLRYTTYVEPGEAELRRAFLELAIAGKRPISLDPESDAGRRFEATIERVLARLGSEHQASVAEGD